MLLHYNSIIFRDFVLNGIRSARRLEQPKDVPQAAILIYIDANAITLRGVLNRCGFFFRCQTSRVAFVAMHLRHEVLLGNQHRVRAHARTAAQ